MEDKCHSNCRAVKKKCHILTLRCCFRCLSCFRTSCFTHMSRHNLHESNPLQSNPLITYKRVTFYLQQQNKNNFISFLISLTSFVLPVFLSFICLRILLQIFGLALFSTLFVQYCFVTLKSMCHPAISALVCTLVKSAQSKSQLVKNIYYY